MGTIVLPNVITAQTTLLQDEQAAVNYRVQQIVASVQLIKALGRGWDVKRTTADGQGRRDTMQDTAANREIALREVLFPTDFSQASEAVFPYAASIADRYNARLHVAHVINLEPFGLTAPESIPEMIKQARAQAHQKIDHLLGTHRLEADRYRAIVAEGEVSEVLIDLIHRNHIELVVLGTQGRRAFKKLLLGSIAEEVFRTAPCPVLTIGPKPALAQANIEPRHVLYLLKFEPDASEAAKYAVSLAQRYAADLTVMNVREDMASFAAQEATQKQILEPFKYWIDDHISEDSDLRDKVRFERGLGPATETILDFVSKAVVDLIVMSVERVNPVMAGHLPKPDIAYGLVSYAPCPVLTIRE